MNSFNFSVGDHVVYIGVGSPVDPDYGVGGVVRGVTSYGSFFVKWSTQSHVNGPYSHTELRLTKPVETAEAAKSVENPQVNDMLVAIIQQQADRLTFSSTREELQNALLTIFKAAEVEG